MRTIRPLLPLILIALVLAACSGSAASFARPAAADGEGGGSTTPAGQPANPEPGKDINGGPIAARDDAKIIRTGSLTLEVSDIPTALRAARDAIVGLGGYVGASTTRNDADRPSAQITYRIPADRWEQALDQLRGLNGLTTKVVAEHTEAVEVTSQVVDLDARIANLRASETALQGIAARAVKIADVLEVQAQLTTTRGEIESLTAQLKELNDRAGYATLTVQYDVPVVAVDVAAKGWDPGAVVDEAAAAMLDVLQTAASAAIWFGIVWLPILLVLGIVTLLVAWVARRLGFGRRQPGIMPPAAPMAGEG